MNSLLSSPYAVFNVKEWEPLLNRQKKINRNYKCNLKKYCYKNFKKYNVQDSNKKEIKKNKLIQLSFA